MKELLHCVAHLTQNEYSNAADHNGPIFNSTHEAYAVIREELEEAGDDMYDVGKILEEKAWPSIKADDVESFKSELPDILRKAIHCSAEMIQAAAMIYKAMLSLNMEPERLKRMLEGLADE